MANGSCNFTLNVTDSIELPYCTADEWVLVLEAIFLAAVVVGSLLANSFVLMLVFKYKALRHRSIIVSLSAVITDLLLVLVFHLPALISVSAREWLFGDLGCKILGFVAFYLIYVRWMAMAVISLDRFFYILFPLTYANWSKPFLITLTINAWFMPFLLHVPSLFGYGDYSFRPGFSQCTIDCKTDMNCYALFVMGFSLQFVIGAVFPTALYLAMYVISRMKRRGKITLGSSLQPVMDKRTSSNGDIQTGHQDQPLHSHTSFFFWSTKDIHALFTFLLVFVTLLLTNIPVYAVTIMRRGFTEQYQQIPIWAHFLIADLFYLSNMLDPLLIMRNRDFRKAIALTFHKRLTLQVNRLRRSSVVSAGSANNINRTQPNQ